MRAFPGTVGESIGMEVRGDGETQVMTQQGWAPKVEKGFAKGARVHTKDGFRPIEDIRVGDLVLSSPEDGTPKLGYKRVVATAVYEKKTLRRINTFGSTSGTEDFVSATGDQPFWVEGRGWTRADALERRQEIRKADGSAAGVASQHPVFRTRREGVGWVQQGHNYEESRGGEFDYANYDVVEQPENPYLSQEVYQSKERYLRVEVYNLAVEDFHTFYVDDGLWVSADNAEQ
jgi:hypothetical protein